MYTWVLYLYSDLYVYIPEFVSICKRSALSLSLRAFSKYSCWSITDSEHVPCFSHSCSQNLNPSLLGHDSVGHFFFKLLTRSDIYTWCQKIINIYDRKRDITRSCIHIYLWSIKLAVGITVWWIRTIFIVRPKTMNAKICRRFTGCWIATSTLCIAISTWPLQI